MNNSNQKDFSNNNIGIGNNNDGQFDYSDYEKRNYTAIQNIENKDSGNQTTTYLENTDNNINHSVLKLIKYISIPLIIILIIIATLYYNGKDSKKDLDYVALANGFINNAKVKIESMNNDCSRSDLEIIFKLDDLISAYTSSISPYGGNIDLEKSYVKVHNNNCNYIYYIYITDNVYEIGSKNQPLLESSINTKSINKIK